MEPIYLETERLTLVSPFSGDWPKRQKFYADHHEYFGANGPVFDEDFLTDDYHKKAVEQEYFGMLAKSQITLYLYLKEDTRRETIVGNINFSNIVRGHFLSCWCGYKMAGTMAGKGYMTEALEASIRYMFEELGMHRIEANIMPENIGSIRVVQKLNFEREGMSPKYLNIQGKWRDHERWCIRNRALELED